jgi:putative phosphoribosyl transferase
MLFEDRHEAGARLASELLALEAQGKLDPTQAVIVALPRDGVAIGYEIGRQLNIPLDVCVVRKVCDPAHPELALAAVAENNACVINEDIIAGQYFSHCRKARSSREANDAAVADKLWQLSEKYCNSAN